SGAVWAAWVKEGTGTDKDHRQGVFLRAALARAGGALAAAAVLDLVGDVTPLLGCKIDDRGIAARAPLALRAADGRAKPAPERRNEQQRAHHIGNKPRQYE